MTALPPPIGSPTSISTFRSATPNTVQRLLSGALPLAPGEMLVFLSLGANLPLQQPGSHPQPPTITLIQALHALHPNCLVLALSSLWRTQPVGLESGLEFDLQNAPQPDFFNACALVRTTLTPQHLLAYTQRLEQRFGRLRPARPHPLHPKAARTLDLDLLLALAPSRNAPPVPVLSCTSTLQLPHPSLHSRRFVLAPLCEVAPTLQHPRLHQSVRSLLDALGPITPTDAATRLDPPEWPALPDNPPGEPLHC